MTRRALVLIATVAMLFLAMPGAMAQSKPSETRKLTLTGRVLDSDGKPVVGMSVMVEESKLENGRIAGTWKIGADGKLANPTATTDATGRFRMQADPAVWAGTGQFTMSGGLFPGTTTNAGILLGPRGAPSFWSVDLKVVDATKPLDLGELTAKKP